MFCRNKCIFLLVSLISSSNPLIAAQKKAPTKCIKSLVRTAEPWKNRRYEPDLYFAPEDRNGTVTLYRGVDEEFFEKDYMGEDFLIWNSTEIEDAIGYAASYAAERYKRGKKRVLILKIVVPKSKVYRANSWPVLKYEDFLDSTEIIESVGEIVLDREIADFARDNPGEDKKMSEFVNRKQRNFSKGRGKHWYKGTEVKRFLR